MPSTAGPGAEARAAALVAGPVGALAVAGALVAWRDELGLANVGFVMTLVVLAAGVAGGRAAGVATSVVAALAFNLFHTQPYLSLAVAAREDLISVVLLGVLGAVVGEVGHRSAERRRARLAAEAAGSDFDIVLAGLAAGLGTDELWRDLDQLVRAHAPARCCRFIAAAAGGPETADGGVVPLPPAEAGAEDLANTFVVPVGVGERTVGRLLLVLDSPAIGRPTAELARRAASVLGIAFARSGSVPDRLG